MLTYLVKGVNKNQTIFVDLYVENVYPHQKQPLLPGDTMNKCPRCQNEDFAKKHAPKPALTPSIPVSLELDERRNNNGTHKLD